MSFGNDYDLDKIEFISTKQDPIKPGGAGSRSKYRAIIPKEIWNKWRPDIVAKSDKIIKFGDPDFEHYKDRIGDWSELDHGNKIRREQYRKRHRGIMMKYLNEEVPAYKVPFSPSFFSYYLLW